MKLDLHNFHKIETDGKSTTLEHPKGHQIKVAHKGLSSELKKQLEELPMKMAKGGGVKTYEAPNPNFSKPSQPSKGRDAAVPEAAYTPPKNAKDAYTEPDNIGTKPVNDVVLSALHREMPPFGPMGAEKPHYPPCINPSCKSYGHSHPNCRCYGGNPKGKPHGEMPGMFAKGGEVGNFCSQDRMHEKGCQYFAEKGMVEEPPAEDTSQSAAPQEQPPAPDQSAPQAPAQGPDINMNPEQAGSAPAAPQEQQVDPVVQKAADINNVLNTEHGATQMDLKNGVINQKTYHDLLWGSDKSVPSKIGSMIGLLIGSAGAGLSGQPNMILHMMDNEIQRDTARQQNSITNEQNIAKLNQQNLLNNGQVALTGQQARQLAFHTTNNMKKSQILDTWGQMIQKMPPGPAQQKAYQQYINASQQVNADILNGNALQSTAIAQEEANPFNQESNQSKPPKNGIDFGYINKLDMLSKQKNPPRYAPSPADMGAVKDEAGKYNQLLKLQDDVHKTSDLLASKFAAGAKSNQRDAAVEQLANKFAGVVGFSEAHHYAESVLPQWNDLGKTRDIRNQMVDNGFETMKAGFPHLLQYKAIQPPQVEPLTEQNVKSKSGREVVVKNGKHYYK